MLIEAPGPLSSRSASVMGLSGRAKSFSTGINGIWETTPDPASESSKPLWARNQGPHKNTGIRGTVPQAPLERPLPGYSFFSHSCQSARNWFVGTWHSSKEVAPWPELSDVILSLLSMLWLCTFQMGLIIYVSLLLLTPKILSLPFDSQDKCIPVLGSLLRCLPQSV